MATFDYKDKKIHYELHGEGAPLLLLNGIMMSTLSWHSFIAPLSANNQLILVDFIDQGQSARNPDEAYTLDLQVDVIKELLSHLGIACVSIAGISYGGNVALKFAAAYPDKVHRLMIFNAAAKTGAWLRELGQSWTAAAGDPVQFYNTTIPIIYSQEFYNGGPDWVKVRRDFLTTQVFTNKLFMDGIVRLTRSADDYDVEAQLCNITAKTLLVASESDPITPPGDQYKLRDLIKDSDLVLLPGVGHATMYERPALFISLITGFANAKLEGLVV
ncbi:MAG: alpha/beta hydrolase [Defluviitaleaceae bacterium]|nr:alpha/beta hydrolase [Defluviitaleaceae bacterium]MCL2273873.1 alpha/beta hydrolase [Defluviitaleaceae bacterium]